MIANIIEKCARINQDFTSYEIISQDECFGEILEAYIEDVEELLPKLKEYFENDLDLFRIKVHGVKGTSRQIGKWEIADFAEIFEMAAKADHQGFIERYLDCFIEELTKALEETKEQYNSL